MRKIQQKRILEMLRTIEQAQAAGSYDDCQQGAMSIGEFIKGIEGEGTRTATLLEDYCELLDRAKKGESINKNLRKHFAKIENSINIELNPDITEIVFMPYNASMWDCMESVWKAANDDPQCNAVVCPVPYYTKNSDGTFDNFHYEGDSLPNYVPVVSYCDYDLHTNLPDVIIIHNPFDEINTVTSVDPAYYSEELKKYTYLLIYIPYFFTGVTFPTMHTDLPSYNNFNYIIMQSLDSCKLFPKIMADKLIPLGNPKTDEIFKLDKHSDMVNIPIEWVEIIRDKKVFFCNTSISSILKYNEEFLDKLETIFKIVGKKENIVLIWRPHPNLRDTLNAIRPSLLERYEQTENLCNSFDNIIYDMSSNANTAISVSDAYIGEAESSIVHLFGILGKPIFLLDFRLVEFPQYEKNRPAHFFDYQVVDNDMWFVAEDGNLLCKMNFNTKKINCYMIPVNNENKVRLYNKIIRFESKLVLIPYNAGEICTFDIATAHFHTIPVRNMSNRNFSNAVIYKDSVFLIPAFYTGILQYNLKTGRIISHTSLFNKVNVRSNLDEPHFFNGVLISGNLLYLASARKSVMFEVNLDTMSVSEHKICDEDFGLWDMDYDGESFWFIANKSTKVLKWLKKQNTTIEIDLPEEDSDVGGGFSKIFSFEDCVYVISKYAKTSMRIDKAALKAEAFVPLTADETARENDNFRWPTNYYMGKKHDRKSFSVLSAYNNTLIHVDVGANTQVCMQVLLNSELILDFFEGMFTKTGKDIPYACRESGFSTCSDFIEYVLREKHDESKQVREYEKKCRNLDGTCGEKIYAFIKNKLK